MIKSNNILVKSFTLLLASYVQTHTLLAMDNEEVQHLPHTLCSPHTIIVSVNGNEMGFDDSDKAHTYFLALANLEKAKKLVEKANRYANRYNAHKKNEEN